MNRTLFAGDLHAKGDLLPFISNIADREHADRIVLLGDICDDWHVSNTGMIRFMERFASWYRAESGRREIVPLLGNHDVPYLMQHGSASFARVRAQAPGFKPGAQRRVHELMKDIPIRIAWTDGTIIATHAGLTRRWGIRRFGHACTGMTADRIAARLNRLPDRPGSLAALYMDDDGPLWARPGHGDYDGRLTQVSGHTPVPSVRNVEGVWLCDTFSTMPDGTPIGDRGMLLADGAGLHATPRTPGETLRRGRVPCPSGDACHGA